MWASLSRRGKSRAAPRGRPRARLRRLPAAQTGRSKPAWHGTKGHPGRRPRGACGPGGVGGAGKAGAGRAAFRFSSARRDQLIRTADRIKADVVALSGWAGWFWRGSERPAEDVRCWRGERTGRRGFAWEDFTTRAGVSGPDRVSRRAPAWAGDRGGGRTSRGPAPTASRPGSRRAGRARARGPAGHW